MKGNKKGSKGFYIALTMSVAMVGAACWFAYSQTGSETENMEGFVSSSEPYVTEAERQAANIVTDAAKPAARVTTATVTSASSETRMSRTKPVQQTQAQPAAAPVQDSSRLSMPIEGEVLNEYSGGELVKSKTTDAWQTHNGIDIKASAGDAVKAAAGGKVTAVENDPLWGITVTIDHGSGIITRYCNLNSGVTVTAGQEVGRGEEIGAVGGTADIESSEKPHLHFEVKKNGSYTDPKKLIG